MQSAQAQLCSGNKGPNLLGAKGTFSEPYITVNTNADPCLANGSSTYNQIGNIGNALPKCSVINGELIPCSDYDYTAKQLGMVPEFTYTLIKNMGDANGHNCIHSENSWKGKDHTGDGGYFLAVNGAPNTTKSPLFYQIKRIPVCIGTTYEFSAYVISIAPGQDGNVDDASPNISFKVNGNVIATSGKIPYSSNGQWLLVGGSFVATTDYVDLEVVNATSVAAGNDLGLDDISIRVCQSRVEVSGPQPVTTGSLPNPEYTVSDPLMENTWFKWQLSTDGGVTFTDETSGEQAIFDPVTKQYKVSPGAIIGEVEPQMNGFMYQLVVSTSKIGLSSPDCIYVNQYVLKVQPEGGPLPVSLTSFEGTYSNGAANLKWQTSQEINNDRFEILRSMNGKDFETVGKVSASGNSSLTKEYQYQDRVNGAGGHLFYKLKQIDKNGRFVFSEVIRLNVQNVAASFHLFPNPVVSSVTASFSAPKNTTATLMVRNTSGQTIYSKTLSVLKGDNSVVINNAPLKTGMYYVTITGEDINYNGKLQKK